jgi:hypothetical protein
MLRLLLQLRFREPVTAMVEEGPRVSEPPAVSLLLPLKASWELSTLKESTMVRDGLPDSVAVMP